MPLVTKLVALNYKNANMRLSILNKSFVSIISFILMVLVISNSLNAATTQGSPDFFASTGTVDVNVTSGDNLILFGMQTVSFGTWNIGDGSLSNTQSVCVGKTGFFQDYAIQATGDGNSLDPSAFTISNGVDQINYTVHWTDDAGQTDMSPATTYFNQGGSAFSFFRNWLFGGLVGRACGAAGTISNADLEVRIPDTELGTAVGGFYSGTLTLLIIPN